MTVIGNHYELLGLEESATPEEIKRAYRLFMKDHHPDLNPGPEHEELCRLASEAYTVLGDPAKRASYDKSLHEEPVTETVDEEWTPSWGEEASWGAEEVFADVVEEETPEARPEPTPTSEPLFENEPIFGSEDRIGKLPPVKVPENIRTGSIAFRSNGIAAAVALALTILAPLVAFVTHTTTGSFAALSFLILPAATIAAAVYVVKWKMTHRLPWWGVVAAPVALYFLLTFLATRLPGAYSNFIFQAAFSAAVTFSILPTFMGYIEDRKILRPKHVKKNNSFGNLSGTVAEEMLENVLNPLWDIPGLRCFRMPHEGFSHMLLFHDKVILLKPVHLHHKGVLKFSGPTLMNRFAANLYQPVLGPEYIASVARYTAAAPKSIKVYPMVVALPGENLLSFEKDDRTLIVAGDDLAALVVDILLKDEEKNVVDHAAAVKALKAAYA